MPANRQRNVRVIIQQVTNGFHVELVTGSSGEKDELVFCDVESLLTWLRSRLN